MTRSEGICMGVVKYGDHQLIAQIFTREHGWLPFMVRVSKKGNAKALFQPFTCLNLEYAFRESREIQQANSVSLALVASKTHSDLHRSSIAMFCAEVLYKTLHREYVNKELYEACRMVATSLENNDKVYAIPQSFLLQLADAFGFGLETPEQDPFCFDPVEGIFSNYPRSGNEQLEGAALQCLISLIRSETPPVIPNAYRNPITRSLLRYLQERLGHHRTIESLRVLEMVYHE